MLSDEEKEAIEYWQYIRDTQIYDGYKGQVYAVTLLNLTEKQSKKIEKLKENKEEYIKKLEETKNKLVRYIAVKEGKDFEQVCREFEI